MSIITKKIDFNKALRIFPIHACNYNCKYCTVYYQYNTPLRWKEFAMLDADTWVKSINKIEWHDWVIISGGEPGIYPDIKKLCDKLDCRNIVLYSNCSKEAIKNLETLEKSIYIYASFHIKAEQKRWNGKIGNIEIDGFECFKNWCDRVNSLADSGHSISQPHVPNDGTFEIEFLPSWLMRTRIEGTKEQTGSGYYSPYAIENRVLSKKTKTVLCSTKQPVIAQDGSIWNCQAKMWSKRGEPLGNIIDFDWNLKSWISCNEYGNCHCCSQSKKVRSLNEA